MGEKSNPTLEELEYEINRLKKVNAALMDRVERSVDDHGSAFSLFEGNVLIGQKVRDRTREIKALSDSVTAEKMKLGRVLCTLPGRTLILDQSLKILDSFQGTGRVIMMAPGSPLELEFRREFSERLAQVPTKSKEENPVSFEFSSGEAEECRTFSCFWSNFGESEYVASIVDVTEMKATQAQLKQNEIHLIDASRLSVLGEMAGGIAHEINTPLGVILLIAERMGDLLDSSPMDAGSLKESLKTIKNTALKVAKIIQGLRSFSRDGSKDPLMPVPVSRIVENTLSLCRERFRKSGVAIIVKEAENAKLSFIGREVEIAQVLLNLLNNAYDAIAASAEKWIKIEVAEVEGNIEFRITDSGGGIPLAIQGKIFQPFFTTKEIGKGTGLGLSVSLGIIQDHGGQLLLDPQSLHTSFLFRLPSA